MVSRASQKDSFPLSIHFVTGEIFEGEEGGRFSHILTSLCVFLGFLLSQLEPLPTTVSRVSKHSTVILRSRLFVEEIFDELSLLH